MRKSSRRVARARVNYASSTSRKRPANNKLSEKNGAVESPFKKRKEPAPQSSAEATTAKKPKVAPAEETNEAKMTRLKDYYRGLAAREFCEQKYRKGKFLTCCCLKFLDRKDKLDCCWDAIGAFKLELHKQKGPIEQKIFLIDWLECNFSDSTKSSREKIPIPYLPADGVDTNSYGPLPSKKVCRSTMMCLLGKGEDFLDDCLGHFRKGTRPSISPHTRPKTPFPKNFFDKFQSDLEEHFGKACSLATPVAVQEMTGENQNMVAPFSKQDGYFTFCKEQRNVCVTFNAKGDVSQKNSLLGGGAVMPSLPGLHNYRKYWMLYYPHLQPGAKAKVATCRTEGCNNQRLEERQQCKKCYNITKRRYEREKEIKTSDKSGLEIFRKPFLSAEQCNKIFNPTTFLGECADGYKGTDIQAAYSDLEFQRQYFVDIDGLVEGLSQQGLAPNTVLERVNINGGENEFQKKTRQEWWDWVETCELTEEEDFVMMCPSTIPTLGDKESGTSLSMMSEYTQTLKDLKASCTKSLKNNEKLWKIHTEKMGWLPASCEHPDSAFDLCANSVMELHPSLITDGLVCFDPHVDKKYVGITTFFCTHGESWNFFCVEGPKGFKEDLGDYELYSKWKENLHPYDAKQLGEFEKALKTKAAANNQNSYIVVHFKPGMVIQFDGTTTVHGVVVPGKRCPITSKKGIGKKGENEPKFRCMGIMFGVPLLGTTGLGFVKNVGPHAVDKQGLEERLARVLLPRDADGRRYRVGETKK